MEKWMQQFQVMTKSLGEDVLEQFPCAEGRYSNFIKEVYFVRYVGIDGEKKYLEKLCRMDAALKQRMKEKQKGYLRTGRLENRIPPEKTSGYIKMFEECRHQGANFPFHFENRMWEEALGRNYGTILKLYAENSGKQGEHFVRNFGVKLLFWMEFYFPSLFLETMKMRQFPKFVCGGEIKLQEYLFLYFLALMGCDVLYLNPEKDIQVASEPLLRLSCLVEEKNKRRMDLPLEFPEHYIKSSSPSTAGAPGKPQAASLVTAQGRPSGAEHVVRIAIPPHPGRSRGTERDCGGSRGAVRSPGADRASSSSGENGIPSASSGGNRSSGSTGGIDRAKANGGNSRTPITSGSKRQTPAPPRPQPGPVRSGSEPLDYVDLAKRASSVVMIGVYNKEKECFKTGSGVIISDRGFILTNFHVACQAAYYGIRLEEEEHIFYTDDLVKYNQYHDLAILRIDRPRAPIPIYDGRQELVRGQKVVAIGSPLGLFNTVSDGIISGFRKLEDVSMIQFTAPTSHGSSGGALLDLYGNLIGIITAGYDDGQNLNLAVDYKTVWMFSKGFV